MNTTWLSSKAAADHLGIANEVYARNVLSALGVQFIEQDKQNGGSKRKLWSLEHIEIVKATMDALKVRVQY